MYEDRIICGVIYFNGDWAEIRCNEETGECFFIDPAMCDARLISEISLSSPGMIDLASTIGAIEDKEFGDCIGVIVDGNIVYKIIDENAVQLYNINNMKDPISDPMTIDVDADYAE